MTRILVSVFLTGYDKKTGEPAFESDLAGVPC